LEYHSKKENQLFLLDACKLIDGFGELRRDYSLLATASYLVELTETLFPLHVKGKKMFYLLKGSFERLCKGEALEGVRLVFEARAMALGGYAIATERCCYCGRIYKGEGRSVFVAEKGGISCLGCRKESGRYPGMDPASVRALRQIQEPDEETAQGPFLDTRTMEEIKAVLEQHIIYRLGKRLKSQEYLG
jgi:DNA repair protein RecO